ncbi:MAG TPA: GAP family protein [Trebonia sp.]
MYEQASGLAALAAIYPPALLIAAAYLGSAHPRKMAGFFLGGAALMTVIVAVVALVALRAGGLSLPSNRPPRYGLRVGLGAVALAAAGYLTWRIRSHGQPDPAKPKKQSRISRMANQPRPLTAFAVGILMFAPSVGFIAAIQVIATSKASLLSTTGAVVLVVIINLLFIWVPLSVYLIAPERTTRALRAINAWLSVRGRSLLAAALAAIGLILLINGAIGLA